MENIKPKIPEESKNVEVRKKKVVITCRFPVGVPIDNNTIVNSHILVCEVEEKENFYGSSYVTILGFGDGRQFTKARNAKLCDIVAVVDWEEK